MVNDLVIVESPTKARTLSKFLGDKYQVEASMGHIRDLPKSELGVETENNFEPKYIIPRDKRKKANEIKKMIEGAKTVWLASDPDREGEAIAWHITHLTTKKPAFKRVVFHEITPEAIKDAFQHPREIDFKLVDAQQARRVLDRLVGYKLSPLLWKKVKRGLSAGRVQSVALRLIVEREREVLAFKPQEYWVIDVILGSEATPESKDAGQASMTLTTTLIEINGKKADISKAGASALKNEKSSKEIVSNLEKAKYVVSKVTKKEVRRFPYAPFTTSTVQQASSNKLGFSAKKTMSLAQGLYEHGLITYMRTDSVNLATSAVSSARDYISANFGKEFLPASARVYKSKSKNAQEAHEAIRPTDLKNGTDKILNLGLNREHVRLYDLIWKRFLACQMMEALMDQTTVDVTANPNYLLRATGSVIKFEGWLKVYGKNTDDEEESHSAEASRDKKGEDEKILPAVSEKEELNKLQVLPSQHFTEPPARYNEASLIKKLEELGIGRPSTYAPIMSTIVERFYVERIDRRLIPTSLGFTVIDFLVKYFPDIVDYAFTAGMEDQLDEIARGEREWRPMMKSFYEPFDKKILEVEGTADRVKVEVEMSDRICPDCGKLLIVRYGRFGKFLACSGFPDCKHTEGLEEIVNAKCPLDGGDIVVRHTKRKKTFYGCKNWPTCTYASWTKPKGEESVVPTEDKNPQ
ncbi:MAG: type I DNA topoisomerase [Candidatus Daviesbacteria bacterium]|nr:type I DNA topoisomerase [Candidatus Daviesbacteria bacterium]